MISFLNNRDAYISRIMFNPLIPLHHLIPLKFKFLPESYVLKDKKEISKINTKNAIYVALSRAINSVAIVYDGKVDEKLNIKVWEENNEQ